MWSSHRDPTRLWDLRFIYIISSFMINLVLAGNEIWPLDRPDGMPTINSLEVMCGKDHMDVHLSFSAPFDGIVSSKGQHSDPRCIYVPPSSGKTFYAFRIAYARCGTKPDLNGQFYENTVVIQYDKDLLEVWDEAKRLRCEWFNDYEKTASKPPMVIADLDVIQLDFRGDNVDCWMEIQSGKGPWAPPVSGIVPIGSTLTLVVAINDFRGEFDMRVKSCVASDGAGHVINLSDEYGCVLRPKMISRFLKARAPDEKATVITYAFFHAFKFPDALSVHIKCKVEICRHGCLDHCQQSSSNERHDIIEQEMIEPSIERDNNHLGSEITNTVQESNEPDADEEEEESSFYEELAEAVGLKSKSSSKEVINNNAEKQQQQHQHGPMIETPEAVMEQKKQQQLQMQQQQQKMQQIQQQQHQKQQHMQQMQQQQMLHQQHIHQQQLLQQQRPPPPPPQPPQAQIQAQAAQVEAEAQAQAQAQQQQQQQQQQQPHFIRTEHDQPQAQAQVNKVPMNPQQAQPAQQQQQAPEVHEDPIDDILPQDLPMHEMLRQAYIEAKKAQAEKFPQGPRTFSKDRLGLPAMAGPRSLNLGEEVRPHFRSTFTAANRTYRTRHRRSVVVSDRTARSADIGVTGVFDVISEADLAFSPRDGKPETETVFQGKIAEEVVYGICMPVPGFSVLFILVTSATVVSALIAGSLLYRYQLQKAAYEAQANNMNMNANTFASWMTLRLFRMNNMHACDGSVDPGLSTPQ